ncbi:hypothetical protein [Fredinandcohnia sp. 179-A 10B2 NHS]|uniref:hypothetical protein n=1 Tax=Fredinandcohnia sp. 179-A 10B2 NHS TaxID=3235176 RepID=UPI0039A3E79E
MKNDLVKAFFTLWGLLLVIEIVWLGIIASKVTFVITLIAVTSVFGSTGIYLFKNTSE